MRAALAIGGLDPCSGAGLAADLRAFRAAGVWGCTACAAITVQSSRGLKHVEPTRAALLGAQIEELMADVSVGAIKTGALGSRDNVRCVARIARRSTRVFTVVDPVLSPSRGRATTLFDARAVSVLPELCAEATLITPNVLEAEALLKGEVRSAAQARDAAVSLLSLGSEAVLLKGGHLKDDDAWSVDWLASADRVTRLAQRRISGRTAIHGTGCTLASLIAGCLAARSSRAKVNHDELEAMVRWARRCLRRMMERAERVGKGLEMMSVPTSSEDRW